MVYFVIALQILLLVIGTNFASSRLAKSFVIAKRGREKRAAITYILSIVCLATIWGSQVSFILLGIYSAGITLIILSVFAGIWIMRMSKRSPEIPSFVRTNTMLVCIEIVAIALFVLSIFL